jgi:hypothetical protein
MVGATGPREYATAEQGRWTNSIGLFWIDG